MAAAAAAAPAMAAASQVAAQPHLALVYQAMLQQHRRLQQAQPTTVQPQQPLVNIPPLNISKSIEYHAKLNNAGLDTTLLSHSEQMRIFEAMYRNEFSARNVNPSATPAAPVAGGMQGAATQGHAANLGDDDGSTTCSKLRLFELLTSFEVLAALHIMADILNQVTKLQGQGCMSLYVDFVLQLYSDILRQSKSSDLEFGHVVYSCW